MADPLSIAGLALAVVSLGLQVTVSITDYFDSLKYCDQDIASIEQQNDTLRKTLQVIESSISRFQNDHRTATEALRQCLDSCKEELKALESMVATLITDNQGTAGRKNKARNKGKELLYPFHRPKLEQIATKLHHINATLQLGLQSLGLSVSHLGSEKLATLHATSQTISSDLLVVQSEVSAISTPIQGIQNTISQFETRFDGLENLLEQLLAQGSTINGTLKEITPALVTGRLLRRPAVLQEMCDAVVTQERHRSKGKLSVPHERAAKFRTAFSSYAGGRFTCLCRHRRHRQRKNASWGSLSLSHETTTEQHAPGCPATQAISEPDRTQKFAFTYVGLRALLNSAIQFSFTIRSGAGGWSLGPNFTYYPIVDSESAPAFRMMSLLMRSRHYPWYEYEDRGFLEDGVWREELIPSVVSSILRLFRAKQASPRAVDDQNQSLVYHVAECICRHYSENSLDRRDSDQFSPLIDLLEYLVINKAPANEFNTCGRTPLSTLFSSYSYTSVTYPVFAASADLILRSNTEDALAHRSYPGKALYTITYVGSEEEILVSSIAVLLDFLSCSTEIAEAYGCGPLGIAILSNDLEEVKTLVAKHPSTLSERNLFGHTPFHLAAKKPSFLRVLVEAADAALLSQTDGSNHSPLECAVSLSRLICREHSRMCKRCTCAECAVILLKADCAIPTSSSLQDILGAASKRCKLRYVRHMKDRRDRLKQLALENLSGTDIQQLGLESERILDLNALKVTQLLQERGIYVPGALAIVGNGRLSGPLPVYQMLSSSDDADIFFRVGFRDTGSWYNAQMVERGVFPPKNLPYLRWLVNHGGLSYQLPLSSSKNIFAIRCIFSSIGYEAMLSRLWLEIDRSDESDTSNTSPAPPVPNWDVAWIHELHAIVFAANITDACRCQCSPGGCTMLTFLLRSLIPVYDFEIAQQRLLRGSAIREKDDLGNITINNKNTSEVSVIHENPLSELVAKFIVYLEQFSCYLEPRHHYATLRYITYTTLGIHHYCCVDWYSRRRMYEDPSDSVEDGLEDDESHTLALLGDLLDEFEENITSILEDPDKGIRDLINFWERTWVGRISEVLYRLEGSDLLDDERRAAEEIGVIWDKVGPELPGEMGNPYQSSTIDYWLYELRKIEEECQ
ncbi:hypothetical protein DER44DRAFT_761358 [Fusarium oxysporum]|nr:hypothetical protein DER44DRAFT_761358 [Fusarium oxysporum]